MEDFLNIDLIQLEEKLSAFKEHHQNKGAQLVHRLVKEMYDNASKSPMKEGEEAYYNGYATALSNIMKMIQERFVP